MIGNIFYTIFIFPLESGMRFVFTSAYMLFSNYGIAIILMSLSVNIVLLPLYYLAERWQGAERKIKAEMQSELDKIKKAFKGEKRYYYTMAVYKRFNYHPLMAIRVSFGFLIQVPFFIAAYHFLSNYAALDGVSFLFLKNLFQPDAFAQLGKFNLNIMPLVMTAVNIFSSYIYTTNLQKNDKIQLWILALLFFVLLYNSPSGLVLYWTLNNIFSLVKNTLSVYVFKVKYLNIEKMESAEKSKKQ
jgi:YidC/Oxa1 family membrane protein insertase